MKVVLVIPTYNERENITALVPALLNVFATMAHDTHILVVDDQSPDGTGDAVRQMQQRSANLHLIEGRKAGLGTAYLRGIRHATEKLGANVVYEMDADFSHNPADVPRLMKEIESGHDFVIGSRYVAGGSVPGEWGFHRKLISSSGNFVARHLAGIKGVRDCTSGFRAMTQALVERIDWNAVRVQGYVFQVALLHAAMVAGARIKEIPIHFVDRTHGESKLGLYDIVEFIVNSWWIRFRRLATFVKFGVVGLSGVVVNLTSFTILMWLGLSKFVASPIAIELSIATNFVLNNYWTFRWRLNKDSLPLRGLKFNAVSLVSLVASYSTFVAITLLFPNWPPQVAQALAIPPAMLINYFLNSLWTFRNSAEAKK